MDNILITCVYVVTLVKFYTILPCLNIVNTSSLISSGMSFRLHNITYYACKEKYLSSVPRVSIQTPHQQQKPNRSCKTTERYDGIHRHKLAIID